MVTHGYVAFRYESIYYIYYNHSDSYCSALGQQVVNEIYNIIDNDYIKYYKKKLLHIPLIDELTEGDNHFHSIYTSIVGYDNCAYFTSEYEPSNEYVYIIDFDEEEFIIKKYDYSYIFDLLNIPEEWKEIVEENEYYEYENKEEKKKNKINNKILELEEEINKLKITLID